MLILLLFLYRTPFISSPIPTPLHYCSHPTIQLIWNGTISIILVIFPAKDIIREGEKKRVEGREEREERIKVEEQIFYLYITYGHTSGISGGQLLVLGGTSSSNMFMGDLHAFEIGIKK
jgi:hypothetical protein